MRETLHGDSERYPGGLHELADGVWAWIQPNGAWGEANAGLVRGDGGSALIDTLWDQRLAREMLESMAPHTRSAPIELVVNTHSDGDHWWGNAKAPGDAAILTSRASLETMRSEPPPSALSRQRRLLRAGSILPRRLPGGFGRMSRYVSSMLAPFEFDGIELRFPDREFEGTTVESVGGRELRLSVLGPAHTPGDLIVHVPDAGVVFGADILFFHSTPVLWHGPVSNWLAALETVLALDAETFVPGHGPVGGRTDVQEVHDYLSWLAESVRSRHALGYSSFEAAVAITADPEFDRWRDWACPERMAISVTTIHRSLDGKGPVPASISARGRLFAEVARLSERLGAAPGTGARDRS